MESIFEKIKKPFIKKKPKDNIVFVYGVVNPKINNDWNTHLVYGVAEPIINLNNIEVNSN